MMQWTSLCPQRGWLIISTLDQVAEATDLSAQTWQALPTPWGTFREALSCGSLHTPSPSPMPRPPGQGRKEDQAQGLGDGD